MEVDIEVKGLDELEKRLAKFPAELGEKTLNSALKSAALPMFKAAKNAAPGSISKAIRRVDIRSTKTRKIKLRGISATGSTAAGVSIIVDKKKAPHAHILELGTEPRYTTGKGKGGKKKKYPPGVFRGKGPALRFMRKAWEAHGGEKYVTAFKKILEKKIKKLERL